MANIRNQRIGVKSGCPDFVVVLKDKIVFIEMKRQKGGVVSDDQVEWIAAILSSGGYAAICKGADEAISYLGKLI
jgi:Holliday junction resolvase